MIAIAVIFALIFSGFMGLWFTNELRHPDKSIAILPAAYEGIMLFLLGKLVPKFWNGFAEVIIALAAAVGFGLLMIQKAHRDLNPGGE